MKKKPQKGAKLNKARYGQFHRNEWAILGTTNANIQKLARQITAKLSPKYKIAYLDADHQNKDHEAGQIPNKNSILSFGGEKELKDKILYKQIIAKISSNSYNLYTQFIDQDIVFINGNYFQSKQQIVVIDLSEEKSLQNSLDQLTDVRLILYVNEKTDVYPFLKEHLPHFDEIPSWKLSDVDATSQFLDLEMEKAKAPLYGLVLAGGKSTRMGKDKGLLSYHGKPQRAYVADLLSKYCEEVYISCRADQLDEIKAPYKALPDSFIGLGPFGGIVSAFRENPNAAWLVLACDLPLLNENTLQQLIAARNISKVATAFNSPVNKFPEPLIAIWEPRAYLKLLEFLAKGYSCPRKVLINSDIVLIDVENAQDLMNVNRPEELEEAKRMLE